MSSHRLIEEDVELIRTHLITTLPTALLAVSEDRETQVQSLEPPREYFTYDGAQGYRLPAIFIVPPAIDFRLGSKGANFIDSLDTVNIAVVVECQTAQDAQYTAYRYMSALHKVLWNAKLASLDEKVQIVVKVSRGTFSETYTKSAKSNDPQARFRKEVMLTCDVEHWENLS